MTQEVSRLQRERQGLEQLGEMALGISHTRWEHDDSAVETDGTRT